MQLLFHCEQIENDFINTIKHLTDDEIVLRKNDDGWTIINILEHIIIVEQKSIERLYTQLKDGQETAEAQIHFKLGELFEKTIERTQKIEAPATMVPQGTLKDITIGLEIFKKQRVLLKQILVQHHDDKLNKMILKHGRLGDLNLREWVTFLNGHLKRHHEQIIEILKIHHRL